MIRFFSRFAAVVVLPALFMAACDGSPDVSDITVNVTIEGGGTGRVETQTLGLDVACRVKDGVTSGTCSDSFKDENGGLITLEAMPHDASSFEWGGVCTGMIGLVCELRYQSGEDRVFDVVGRFETRTKKVVIIPSPAAISSPDPIVLTAQALDASGATVYEVEFEWSTEDGDIVTVTPQANTSLCTVTPLKDGLATILATTQGVTGRTVAEVTIGD